MSTTDLPIHDIITGAIAVDIPKNSIIVMFASREQFQQNSDEIVNIAERIRDTFPSNSVMIAANGNDPTEVLTTISEEKMNELGWYKKE